jgi:peptidoglycan/LPS O-acetylase OafA/YrhL
VNLTLETKALVLEGHDKKESTGAISTRIPELDGIRGVAILLVLIWHFFVVPIGAVAPAFLKPLWVLLGMSWAGVDLFFVLSGFLIGGILLDNRESQNYFKTFYVRRACRILPIYYLFVIIYFCLAVAGFGREKKDLLWLMNNPLPFWSYASFIQNFLMSLRLSFGCGWLGVTWSLAIEEQFYLILPIIIRYLPVKRLPWVLLGGALLAPIIRSTLMFFERPEALAAGFVLMPCRADALLFGVLGSYALRMPTLREMLLKNKATLYSVFLLFLAGAIGLTLYSPNFMAPTMNRWGRSWLALFFLLFLLISILHKNGILASFMRSELLRRLGTISYGVYLMHQVVFSFTLAFIFPANGRNAFQLFSVSLVAFILTLAISALSYRFFEKPIIHLGHRQKY